MFEQKLSPRTNLNANKEQQITEGINKKQSQINITQDKVQDKARNVQVENLLQRQQQIGKSREIIRQFLKRNYNENDKIVCMIKTSEGHLRRGAEARGWFENKVFTSSMFDVKFELQDQQSDYSSLKSTQMFNHFPNNSEVTTKAGLVKNLYAYSQPGFNVDTFFPRCYDLTDTKQLDEYTQDFQQTSIFLIIKKLHLYFRNKTNNCGKNTYKEIQQLGQKGYNYREMKSNIVLKLVQMFPMDQEIIIAPKLLNKAMIYCKNQIKNKKLNDKVKNELKGENKDNDDFVSEKMKKLMAKFSKLWPPYSYFPEDLMKLKTMMSWEQPSVYLIYKIYKCHKLLKKCFAQYKIDGLYNVWIVKPPYNSRGFGIHCIDSIKELQQNGKKPQSKIVQKYIERPFLLNIQGRDKIEMRKFDIRQWVLVTSFDPLKICVFSDFYLRICGSEFTMDDIQNNFRHLSNYSIQKNNN